MSTYSESPLERLPEHYDHQSVLVEMTGDGQWKRPTVGARDIVDRLIELNLTMEAGEWGMVTCQRMRDNGLITVLASANGRRWQILIVNRSAAVAAATSVVRIHFHVAMGDGTEMTEEVTGGGDRICSASFQQRFEDWATSLDTTTLARHRTAMHTGLSIAVDFYASLERRRTNNQLRWRYYDPEARFTCTKNGGGGDRVHVGMQSIRKRYEWLALDHRYTKLRSFECYGSPVSKHGDKSVPDYTAILVSGTVPDLKRTGDKAHREFVQLLVVNTRTCNIINDVLCFQQPSRLPRPQSEPINGLYASSSSLSLLSSSSLSSLSSSSSLSVPQPPLRSMPSTAAAAISLIADCSDLLSSSTGSVDGFLTWDDENDDDDDDKNCSSGGGGGGDGDFTELRSRVTNNALKIRSGTAAFTVLATGGFNQQPAVSKLNPRQLFIGCVPLHVKYGQLKLLFEQFGEVTYVKVYDGFNKQTGAKMSHNYAFLFFKDEESVERAIAASPVPLDATWNLNVSRPHHHLAAVAASNIDR